MTNHFDPDPCWDCPNFPEGCGPDCREFSPPDEPDPEWYGRPLRAEA